MFEIQYHLSYIVTFLKNNLHIKYGKPYRRDYRRSPYYKSTFKLNLYQKFCKYCLKYDEKTGNIHDINSLFMEVFLQYKYVEDCKKGYMKRKRLLFKSS